MTANFEYLSDNRENLRLPIQMQLFEKSKKPFAAVFASILNFEHFEEKATLITQVFLKLLTPKDVLT